MELRSQKVRELAPEMDPLRMGMGWKAEELSKPQIIIESTYGNSHPGSSHLNIFVEEAVKGVDENGRKSSALLCNRYVRWNVPGTRWNQLFFSTQRCDHKPCGGAGQTLQRLMVVFLSQAVTRQCRRCL